MLSLNLTFNLMNLLKFGSLFMMSDIQNWRIFEDNVRKLIEDLYKTTFPSDGLVKINGKTKKFDFVNLENNIVGDAKYYSFTKTGKRPSAKFSILNEYIWLLQKLPSNWKKFIVIGKDETLVKKYVNEYLPWLEGITIYYSDGENELKIIKD
jgi:glutathione peroxidase-family protein